MAAAVVGGPARADLAELRREADSDRRLAELIEETKGRAALSGSKSRPTPLNLVICVFSSQGG